MHQIQNLLIILINYLNVMNQLLNINIVEKFGNLVMIMYHIEDGYLIEIEKKLKKFLIIIHQLNYLLIIQMNIFIIIMILHLI